MPPADEETRQRKWFIATVIEILPETPRVKTLVLDVPDWPGHKAGQHVDVRLTAEDGYRAQRSYSIASPPDERHIALTIELVDGGEVSDYFIHELRAGDRFELRGPIGGHFIWTAASDAPLLLVGGGSGIVPLMAMLRHHRAIRSRVPARLVYSVRSEREIIYRGVLADMAKTGAVGVSITLTRDAPANWTGFKGRITPEMLSAAGFPPESHPVIYICGSNGFVDAAASALIALGHNPAAIKTERFGPSS